MRLLLTLLLVLTLAPETRAQQTTGRLQGRLVRANDQGTASANVVLTTPAAPGALVLSADRDGHFAAAAVPPGEYRLTISARGFREVVIESVRVRLGETTSIGDIALVPALATLAPVVVTRARPAVDPRSTAIASRIDARTAELLPAGRDYTSMVLMMPQVNESQVAGVGLDIGGATSFENAYFVDGINVTEGFSHRGGLQLPASFVEHVELKSGGYEAEFGRAQGGIISVTTRSGRDTPSFSAFSYYTGSGLGSSSTRSAYDLTTGRFARSDIGVAAEGPIVRDRLWYFAAYDAAFASEEVALPGGPQTDRSRVDHFAGKLTWRPDGGTRVSATVIGDPGTRDLVGNAFWAVLPIKTLLNADPYLAYWDQGGVAAAVSANRVRGRTVWEATVAHAVFHNRTGPATERGAREPLLVNFATGEWSGGHGNQWNRRTTRSSAAISATTEAGPHTFKLGAQIEENDQNESWQWVGLTPQGEGIIFTSGSGYVALPLDLQARTRARMPTAFAQASFLALPRLRVNAGLRWDGQYFDGRSTGTSSAITGQWQPRVGLVIYPTASTTQKLTASFGRFYEQLPGLPISWYWGGVSQQIAVYAEDPRFPAEPVLTWSAVKAPAEDLRGQHYDEVTAGYDAAIASSVTLTLRVSRRMLREVITAIEVPERGLEVLANPGRGEHTTLPRPNSRYQALEASLIRDGSKGGPSYLLSYVLSRKAGNYVGVNGHGNPNAQVGSSVMPTTGLLPNDRTHVLKAALAHRVRPALTLGILASVQSGTPVTDRGLVNADPGSSIPVSEQGAAGRTPTLWDLSLRGTYDVGGTRKRARLIADVLHAFSARRAISVDALRYLAVDPDGSNPRNPSPFYRRGTLFQAPMTLRLGLELGYGSSGR